MSDLISQIDLVAKLIDEFGLDQAQLKGEDWEIKLVRSARAKVIVQPSSTASAPTTVSKVAREKPTKKSSKPTGIPINSPTTGIFYSSPSPGSPSFVNIGDTVEAGQVIGLIEAMKVFNEITATVSGVVKQVAVENGQLVQPGDALIYIG